MKYSKPLHPGSTIGICAPSAGVGHKIESFELSLDTLRSEGYRILETESVRNDNIRSNTAEIRGKEFNELVADPAVDMILAASGGDYNPEMLPYIDWEALASKGIWVGGASDPTNILYPLTTRYDIATVYGFNAGSFDWRPLHPFQDNALAILRGDDITQESFDFCDGARDFSADGPVLDYPVYWTAQQNGVDTPVEVTGRLIGGCIDCIAKLIGTPYDGTDDFLNRYADEDIIWYFDPFQMSAEALYLTMLQMKFCGYFRNTAAVIFGRVMFTEGSTDEQYLEHLARIFDVPVIWNSDIGHVKPCLTLINGSVATIRCQDGKGSIHMELK